MGNVALFIDYENVYWSLLKNYGQPPCAGKLVRVLKEIAARYGDPVLALAYADFDQPEFKGLQTELQRHSVEPRHVFSKTVRDSIRKNAADIELSLDALEYIFVRPDIDNFLVVCGDRDVIGLTRKLHTHNRRVYVVGVRCTASQDLQQFADEFVALEDLLELTPISAEKELIDDPVVLEFIIRRVAELESGRLAFIGLKLLIHRLLGSVANAQLVVNQAIEKSILLTYQVPNPVKPDFPTTAVKLNREHDLVGRLLGETAVQSTAV
jgi:uncharacterized LabA/DUF88 family protein